MSMYAGDDGNVRNFIEGSTAWENDTGYRLNDLSITSDEQCCKYI